ncbi:hypothetical protein [Bacillus oleivorans]|nr:hypothetical protein [Bacillus oleivorans]
MLKKIMVCAFLFSGLFITAWAANEQQRREYMEWDEVYDIDLIPISTETNLHEKKKVYKYKPREYVRISTAS